MSVSCQLRRVAAPASVALALALVPLSLSAPAQAATVITVNTTADSLAVDGHCSLREAVRAANLGKVVDTCAGHAGANSIAIPQGHFTLTIAGRGEDAALTGDLDLRSDVTLTGNSAATTVIDGNALDRVFQVFSGAQAHLSRMTVTGGMVSVDDPSLAAGGGIANQGSLVVTDSVVSFNRAGVGISGDGAGIFNTGTLTLRDVTVSDNSAGGGGGGIASSGDAYLTRVNVLRNSANSLSPMPGHDDPGDAAGIDSSGYLELMESLVAGNTGSEEWTHGGVAMTHGVISDSTIRGNHAADCGTGGVVMVGAKMLRSTVSGNSAGACDGAGGIAALDSTITNSTISSNTSGGQDSPPGGEMRVGGIASDNSLILNSTIAGNVNLAPPNNSAPGSGGLLVVGMPTSWVLAGPTLVRNTILAGNRDSLGVHRDCTGVVTSDGHNLLASAKGCTFKKTASDLIGVDPMLGPLANNGGPTQTQMPRLGSPAIDAWNSGPAGPTSLCPAVDQRSVTRPQDGDGNGRVGCDIGSVERAAPRP